MKFRQFALTCECGLTPTRIRQVGLSTEHQLVIHWWCIGCRKAMYVVKDLAECWEESPKPEDVDIVPAPGYDIERKRHDTDFLHEMGICFPSENDDR
ncbi:MAG TPA: hypothetical protein VHW09_12695 [Bryobacteraceae bacterium]|nr:hypothetical protein [Bryobacteraceae bacterium]